DGSRVQRVVRHVQWVARTVGEKAHNLGCAGMGASLKGCPVRRRVAWRDRKGLAEHPVTHEPGERGHLSLGDELAVEASARPVQPSPNQAPRPAHARAASLPGARPDRIAGVRGAAGPRPSSEKMASSTRVAAPTMAISGNGIVLLATPAGPASCGASLAT